MLGACTGLLAGMFGIGGAAYWSHPLFYFITWVLKVHDRAHGDRHIAGKHIFFCYFLSLSHHNKSSGVVIGYALSVGMILGCDGLDTRQLYQTKFKVDITIFLIVIGIEMIIGFTQTLAKKDKDMIPLSKSIVPFHGSWIGFLSSIIGIGGGSFTTPLMVSGGYNIRKGIGTAAACGVPIAASGAIGYMYYGQMADANLPTGAVGYVFWPAVISISLASIFTAKLGQILVTQFLRKLLKSLLVCFLIFVGIMVVTN